MFMWFHRSADRRAQGALHRTRADRDPPLKGAEETPSSEQPPERLSDLNEWQAEGKPKRPEPSRTVKGGDAGASELLKLANRLADLET